MCYYLTLATMAKPTIKTSSFLLMLNGLCGYIRYHFIVSSLFTNISLRPIIKSCNFYYDLEEYYILFFATLIWNFCQLVHITLILLDIWLTIFLS